MKKIFFLSLISFTISLYGQSKLKPGFDADEYSGLLSVSSQHMDSLYPGYVLPLSNNYQRVYRSSVVGLENRFDVYVKDNEIGIISLRGTVAKGESWIENFYMGMISNEGNIIIDKNRVFSYKVASDTNAYVHLGWMLGLAHLAPEIVKQLNALYAKGIKDVLIFGHSQGGALAFLLRSYLQYLDEKSLPKDITYKTYCSAPPKPGNLFYSYDYDFITRGGWGFRVVNALDWVPESPFTVQTTNDVNVISPLRNREESMKRLGFASRFYLKMIYRKLNRSTKRSLKLYNKYLGHKLYRLLRKNHPEYIEPKYKPSINYSITGTPVILKPTPAYEQKFPHDPKNGFLHHTYRSYLFITKENFKK
ncbi:MAG: lipase family protein [Bacteroidia bacterium]